MKKSAREQPSYSGGIFFTTNQRPEPANNRFHIPRLYPCLTNQRIFDYHKIIQSHVIPPKRGLEVADAVKGMLGIRIDAAKIIFGETVLFVIKKFLPMQPAV